MRYDRARNRSMHDERMHDDGNVAQTTASDLKAVAEDMLRMGRHWARAAQGWLERASDQAQARARSDRDLQSDYGGDGYDQVDGGRRARDFDAQDQTTGGTTRGYGYAAGDAYGPGPDAYPGGRDFGGRDYRGVGPRNYTRSDERIREDLNERLTEAYDLDASGLAVDVEDGVATLTGSVPQRWMKHRAEDLADGCIGVRDVRNQIRVEGAGSDGNATSTTSNDAGKAGPPTGNAGSTGKETP